MKAIQKGRYMDLSVKYMGLNLKTPIIVGSSGLTNTLAKLKAYEANGAGAVILKSLFEEQIQMEVDAETLKNAIDYPEAADYISAYAQENSINKYLDLIKTAKQELSIPVIGSINCVSSNNWLDFAKKMEEAGADALELNISLIPTDTSVTSAENEKIYFKIVESVKKHIEIPIALKMSHFSAGLANLVQQLSWTKKVDAFTLFNRYYQPDIDIEKMELTSTGVFSSHEDISASLRWVGVLSDKIDTDISASTGVHSGADVIKQILAGATTVQMVSAIYQNGADCITEALKDMEAWMNRHQYESLNEFRGKVSYKNVNNSAIFDRVQFMKYFGTVE